MPGGQQRIWVKSFFQIFPLNKFLLFPFLLSLDQTCDPNHCSHHETGLLDILQTASSHASFFSLIRRWGICRVAAISSKTNDHVKGFSRGNLFYIDQEGMTIHTINITECSKNLSALFKDTLCGSLRRYFKSFRRWDYFEGILVTEITRFNAARIFLMISV